MVTLTPPASTATWTKTALVTNAPPLTSTATWTYTPTITNTPRPSSTRAPTLTVRALISPTFTGTPNPNADKLPSATATLGIGSTFTREKDGMVMVYVPDGPFIMGSENEDDEKPIHTVTLDAFWIDRTEVTNEMYALCVQSGLCQPPDSKSTSTVESYYGNSDYTDYPVIQVSWNDAVGYCEWAGGHLPSEAEWEKAARGTNGRTYPWGEGLDKRYANYAGKDTTRVGSYESGKSPYGAYDLAGNVWEWVDDWYAAYPGSTVSDSNYKEKSKVLRGGSWDYVYSDVRSAFRSRLYPTVSNRDVGFRCSRSQ